MLTLLRSTVHDLIIISRSHLAIEDMSDTETQTSEYCTALETQEPETQEPSQPSPEEAGDDTNVTEVTTEREKYDSFGLFENLPGNVSLTKFLPAAIENNMLSFITGKDSLEQPQ